MITESRVYSCNPRGRALGVDLLDDPQIKIRELRAEGKDGDLSAQAFALGKAQTLVRIQLRRRGDERDAPGAPRNDFLKAGLGHLHDPRALPAG
jgi:hypothetical protein